VGCEDGRKGYESEEKGDLFMLGCRRDEVRESHQYSRCFNGFHEQYPNTCSILRTVPKRYPDSNKSFKPPTQFPSLVIPTARKYSHALYSPPPTDPDSPA
jgi:hypothetical protein